MHIVLLNVFNMVRWNGRFVGGESVHCACVNPTWTDHVTACMYTLRMFAECSTHYIISKTQPCTCGLTNWCFCCVMPPAWCSRQTLASIIIVGRHFKRASRLWFRKLPSRYCGLICILPRVCVIMKYPREFNGVERVSPSNTPHQTTNILTRRNSRVFADLCRWCGYVKHNLMEIHAPRQQSLLWVQISITIIISEGELWLKRCGAPSMWWTTKAVRVCVDLNALCTASVRVLCSGIWIWEYVSCRWATLQSPIPHRHIAHLTWMQAR